MPLGKIDRDAVPFPYMQIVEQLRQMIDDREYSPGSLIPSEKYLGEHYEVARETVRKAIGVLKDEGYLQVAPQRGMFVTSDPPRPGTRPKT